MYMKIVKFPRNDDIFKYMEKHGLHLIDSKPEKRYDITWEN